MTIKIDIEFDPGQIERKLSGVARDKWPKILSEAATETAFYVRNKVRSEMPRYIDKPKPFTLNSIFVRKGTQAKPEASVEWRRPSGGVSGGRYLRPTVFGGGRSQKGLERLLEANGAMPKGLRAVPTDDAPKDAFGNVLPAFIRKVAAAIVANPTGRNVYQKTKGLSKVQSFFAVPQKQGNLSPGIYETRATGFGNAIRRVFSFVSNVNYKRQFPFYEIGQAAACERFEAKLDEAINRSING